jgi:hypothetical protein
MAFLGDLGRFFSDLLGGSDDPEVLTVFQQPTRVAPTPTPAPIDLTQQQAAIDVQKAAREATAEAPNPTVSQSAPPTTLGDTAAQTLAVPDFLKTTPSMQPAPLRKSKLVTTDEGRAAASAAERYFGGV